MVHPYIRFKVKNKKLAEEKEANKQEEARKQRVKDGLDWRS